jgi:hypothetical protein
MPDMLDDEQQFKDYIKSCVNSLLKENTEKPKLTKNKLHDITKEDESAFESVIKFVVNKKTGEAGLLIDYVILESWDKTLTDVLLDNIQASLALLKHNLK